jgi:hypothetical protein
MEHMIALFILSIMANVMLTVALYVKDHELQRIRRLYRDACAGFIPFNMWEADDDA